MASLTDNGALSPMVRKLAAWAALSPEDERAILELPYTVRSFSPGGYIVRDGDKPQNSCVLLSGFAYRHKIVGDGGRQILSIHMKGDLVDLHNSLLHTADHNVQALSQVELACIPHEAVKELAFARPTVGVAMWYDTLVDASIHREWIANVGRRDGRTRTAHLLCEFGVRLETAGLGSTREYDIPMTQEQLSDCTGLTPVHMSRSLKALESEGLVRRTKRAVSIDDWGRLAEAGDFRPDYLHVTMPGIPLL